MCKWNLSGNELIPSAFQCKIVNDAWCLFNVLFASFVNGYENLEEIYFNRVFVFEYNNPTSL